MKNELTNLVGIPVAIQLRQPALGLLSAGIVEVADKKFGRPELAVNKESNQPVPVFVHAGAIELLGEEALTLSTLGIDGQTVLTVILRYDSIHSVTLIQGEGQPEPEPEPSRIVLQ